jgi:hypothetical protein
MPGPTVLLQAMLVCAFMAFQRLMEADITLFTPYGASP